MNELLKCIIFKTNKCSILFIFFSLILWNYNNDRKDFDCMVKGRKWGNLDGSGLFKFLCGRPICIWF